MGAGQYNRLVDILQASYSQDAFGERALGDWSTATVFASVYVKITPVQGREVEVAKKFAATVSHKIDTYYILGLDDTMRLRFTPATGPVRYFNINGILQDEKDRFMSLYCTETPS